MINSFAAALSKLLDLLIMAIQEYQKIQREQAAKTKQEKVNRAKTDIVGAFNDHFGGMRNGTGDGKDATQAGGTEDPGRGS